MRVYGEIQWVPKEHDLKEPVSKRMGTPENATMRNCRVYALHVM
jgi:hypothetical protein